VSPARTRPPWWTGADQAEFDVLVWELLRATSAHDERCEVCRSLPPGFSCPPLADAIEAVIDWHRGRRLLSRAEWHRRRRILGWLVELERAEASS
jgi:hypothetical protein